jgi:hypothetical protein
MGRRQLTFVAHIEHRSWARLIVRFPQNGDIQAHIACGWRRPCGHRRYPLWTCAGYFSRNARPHWLNLGRHVKGIDSVIIVVYGRNRRRIGLAAEWIVGCSKQPHHHQQTGNNRRHQPAHQVRSHVESGRLVGRTRSPVFRRTGCIIPLRYPYPPHHGQLFVCLVAHGLFLLPSEGLVFVKKSNECLVSIAGHSLFCCSK